MNKHKWIIFKSSNNRGFTFKRSANKGFTLIEILVSLALSSIVFVIVSTVLLTLFTANTKSRRQEAVQQVKNDIFVEVSNSIRWADSIAINNSTKTLVVDSTTYSFNGNSLFKNGTSMTPDYIEVTRMDLREAVTVPVDISGHSPYPGIEMDLELRNKNSGVNTQTLKIFVARRKNKIEI